MFFKRIMPLLLLFSVWSCTVSGPDSPDIPFEDDGRIVYLDFGKERELPFQWFRSVLQTPSWHKEVYDRVRAGNSNAVLLDAPSFFELLRCYLEEQL